MLFKMILYQIRCLLNFVRSDEQEMKKKKKNVRRSCVFTCKNCFFFFFGFLSHSVFNLPLKSLCVRCCGNCFGRRSTTFEMHTQFS